MELREGESIVSKLFEASSSRIHVGLSFLDRFGTQLGRNFIFRVEIRLTSLRSSRSCPNSHPKTSNVDYFLDTHPIFAILVSLRSSQRILCAFTVTLCVLPLCSRLILCDYVLMHRFDQINLILCEFDLDLSMYNVFINYHRARV